MAKASLGGVVILGSAPARWTLRAGTDPVIETFDFMPEDAERLLWTMVPQTLLLENVETKNLWVIGEMPAENANIRRLVVADRRWFWSYSHIYRRYNMRRRTGIQRISVQNGPMQTAPLDDVVKFHKWSLFEDKEAPVASSKMTPWTARQAIKDILAEVLKLDSGGTPAIADFIPTGIGEGVPLEDVIIDDAGDAAIEKVLGYFPGIKIWVDPNGGLVLDSELAVNAENEKLLPEIVGGGHIIKPTMAKQRPQKIVVKFTREQELRFDFTEDKTAHVMTVVKDTPSDIRFTRNVLPVPDYQLPLAGGPDALAQGTWTSITNAMSLWGQVTPAFGVMDYDVLMELMLPFNNLAILLTGLADRSVKDWGSRFSALMQHFRQTWQIQENWMSKISSIHAYRVATINPTTGMRAPAVMYGDYVAVMSHRLVMDMVSKGVQRDVEYVRNFTTYPANGIIVAAGGDNDTKAAPAVITILDGDQGVIRADFVLDPLRLADVIIPGEMATNSTPRADIDYMGADYRAFTFDSIKRSYGTNDIPRLKTEYKCAFILTAVPGAPNNTDQLFSIEIAPGDVKDMLDVGRCLGPVMTLRIPPSVETARFAWNDDYATDIDATFGAGLGPGNPTRMLDLCVNYKSNDKGASLYNIARATAARIWAAMADHPVGVATGALNAMPRPAGFIQQVAHTITGTGEEVTHIICPEKLKQTSMFRYLDPGTRAMVLREVPKGA